VAKLVARLLVAAALWDRILTSLKKTKWATKAKEWPTRTRPLKNCPNYVSALPRESTASLRMPRRCSGAS